MSKLQCVALVVVLCTVLHLFTDVSMPGNKDNSQERELSESYVNAQESILENARSNKEPHQPSKDPDRGLEISTRLSSNTAASIGTTAKSQISENVAYLDSVGGLASQEVGPDRIQSPVAAEAALTDLEKFAQARVMLSQLGNGAIDESSFRQEFEALLEEASDQEIVLLLNLYVESLTSNQVYSDPLFSSSHD